MIDWNVNAIASRLAKHGPDAVMMFIIYATTITAISIGGDRWFFSFLGAAAFYGYSRRQSQRERHLEHMAELKVKESEAKLAQIQVAARKQIEKEKQAAAAALPRVDPKAKK